ncbi:unnamed protein product, partial [Medioppia subpectinata]
MHIGLDLLVVVGLRWVPAVLEQPQQVVVLAVYVTYGRLCAKVTCTIFLIMADSNKVDIDSIIQRLLEVRGSRPGKSVQLSETEIKCLCNKSREIFLSQPILLELEAPLKICG